MRLGIALSSMYFNKRMGLAPSSHVTFTISSSDHALLLGHRKLYCVELCSWLILGWKTAAHSLTSSLGCLLWQSWSWGKEKANSLTWPQWQKTGVSENLRIYTHWSVPSKIITPNGAYHILIYSTQNVSKNYDFVT